MSAFTLFIKERLPFFAALWTDQRSARYFRRRYGALNRDARQRLFGTGPAVVLTGPYRGLGYPTESGWGSLVPKWLGTYECELAAIVTDVVRQRPAIIVDIGSAEGYYADLLAARFSATHRQVRVAARERDPKTDSTGLPPAIIADPVWLHTAMDEGRGESQCWLWLVPPATGTA